MPVSHVVRPRRSFALFSPARGYNNCWTIRRSSGDREGAMIRKVLLAAGLIAAALAITAFATGQDGRAPDNGQKKDDGKKKGRGVGGLGNKSPDFPANLFVSASTVAHTPLRHESVDISAGKTKLHTWIEYPSGDAKAS